jgi:hypothetical protein
MKAEELQQKLFHHLDKIEMLINLNLVYKGEPDNKSHKLCLTHTLGDLYEHTRAIEDADMQP